MMYGVGVYPLIMVFVGMIKKYIPASRKYDGLMAFTLALIIGSFYLYLEVGKRGFELVMLAMSFAVSVPMTHKFVVRTMRGEDGST